MPSHTEQDRVWEENRRWIAAVLVAHRPPGVDVEDLLQDVALAFVRSHLELRDARALRPWLRRCALNAAASAARRTGVREKTAATRLDWTDVADPANALAARRAGAAERVAATLDRVLALPVKYAEPLLLKAVQGLSQRAIAEILKLPVTTIETRLVRARRMVRDAASADARTSDATSGGPNRWNTHAKRSS
ncbi:MAG: hypothetical protein CMJ83_03620 [Planctomycetes bacterium]|nr:hypothetical protein [Planctomycetota bacterium]